MPDNWSRFTKNAQAALKKASFYAEEYPSDFLIMPDHLLLGILDQPNCSVSIMIFELGIDLKQLKKELKPQYPLPTDSEKVFYKTNITFSLSPELKQVLYAAASESNRQRSYKINTRFLLVGLIQQKSPRINQVLESHGITMEIIRSRSH